MKYVLAFLFIFLANFASAHSGGAIRMVVIQVLKITTATKRSISQRYQSQKTSLRGG